MNFMRTTGESGKFGDSLLHPRPTSTLVPILYMLVSPGIGGIS
jgi:hypothetical protein